MAEAKTAQAAFVAAYGKLPNPKKNAANPAFKSKYANLEELLSVTRPVLAALGLALVQEPVSDGDRIGVHTRLLHEGGDVLDFGSYTVPLVKHDAQGAGSAITYTRRYAIAAIFGLAQEDDDGNAAARPAAKVDKPSPDSPRTEAQSRKAWALAKECGMDEDGLRAFMEAKTGKASSRELTIKEAGALIDALEAFKAEDAARS